MNWPVIHRFIRITFLVAVVLSTAFLLHYLKQPGTFPITTVRVDGSFKNLSKQTIEATAAPFVHTGFFAFSANELSEQLQNLPWVEAVSITRKWPDTLILNVTEKIALARFGDDGVITAQGEVFFPDLKTIKPDLPVLNGPPAMAGEIAKTFLAIQARLRTIGVVPVSLTCSDRHAWTVVLNNAITLELGRRDILNRVALFTRSYHKIVAAHIDSIDTIDLRYNKGLAVKWKKQT